MKQLAVFVLIFAWHSASAQAFKYPLFEHFTQASCGPCASQNPGFQSTILDPNPHSVRHIAYHTSWPGVDPMYTENQAANNARVSYYSITGVPTIVLQGNYKKGQPGAMTMGDVNYIISQTSPVKITVTDTDNGSTHDVTVRIKSIGTPPSGSFRLMTVIIERNIWYTNPPGSNGEKYFPNVMRYILPTNNGELITLPAQGNEAVYTYTYTEDPDWNMAEIGVVSFLQHSTTKEVINVGSSFDQIQNALLQAPAVTAQQAQAGQSVSFSLQVGNGGYADEDFVIAFSSDAPADWSADLLIDGNVVSNPATVSLAADVWKGFSLQVQVGNSPALATYEISISSAANPLAPQMKALLYVISGITDLVINNAAGNGVTPGDASAWEDDFLNGLAYSGNTTYAAAMHPAALAVWQQGALQGVQHIYLNVGWTFPGLPEEMVTMLKSFMDQGGNVLITGQDVAWESFDNNYSPYASVNKQNFLKDYFKVDFVSDGNSSNKPLTANMNDIFTSVPSATINAYYGTSYFYPDQLKLVSGGIPVFYYNNNTAKIAGIRAESGGHKTVFLGVGLEMIGTATDKNNIIKTTHDWFHGLISSAEWEAVLLGFSAYPQPASSVLTLQVPRAGLLEAYDLCGRRVHSQQVSGNGLTVHWNVSGWAAGHYVVRFTDAERQHALLISVLP
ncbi:MAG: Omp28-related outer membrane protein [Chitinophagales bacterium]|nr:Omp28-related outer membrane protein [Chitinophagales bacterium]MDW8393721.1 Omp28-related outer membrane protein [Chitinophagales bacterium]